MLLGSWALSKKELFKEHGHSIVPYHYDDRSLLKADFDLSNQWSDTIFEIVYPALNSLHEVSFSRRFWEIILFPWLSSFVQVLTDRYRSLSVAKERHSFSQVFPIIQEYSGTVATYSDWGLLVGRSEVFNSYIYSLLIGEMNEYCDVSLEKVASEVIPSTSHPVSLKATLKKILSKCVLRVSSVLVTTDYFSLSSLISLFIKSKGKISPLFTVSKQYKNNKNCDMRQQLKERLLSDSFPCDDRLFEVLVTLLPSLMPLSYLESFLEVYQNENERSLHNKTILSSNLLYYEDTFKVRCAKAVESSLCKLIFLQHGGLYGLSQWSQSQRDEDRISDLYVSWGWGKREGRLPLSHPKFSEIKPLSLGSDIVLIDNQFPRYFYINSAFPVPGKAMMSYLNTPIKFCNHVNSDVMSVLKMRFFPGFVGDDWGVKSHFQSQFPDVSVDLEPSFLQTLNNALVVVCWHNLTTFLQVLLYNKPLILILDTSYWELSKDGKEGFKLLEDAHILFSNSQEAAHFLNDNHNDVGTWWYSEHVQQSVASFVAQFCRKPQEWTTEFLRAIEIKEA